MTTVRLVSFRTSSPVWVVMRGRRFLGSGGSQSQRWFCPIYGTRSLFFSLPDCGTRFTFCLILASST